PTGDTLTRRSTFDSILAGCIPCLLRSWRRSNMRGIFRMTSMMSYLFKGVSVVEVLKGIPKSRARKTRKKLIEMIIRIVYRRHGSSLGLRNQKDAFDIAVTIQRIKARLESLSDI
ncbi:probable xyloglucan galactosyltransferase GT19, partial [Tanacetum coccineum]